MFGLYLSKIDQLPLRAREILRRETHSLPGDEIPGFGQAPNPPASVIQSIVILDPLFLMVSRSF
jgi:hypothetical protein